MQQLTLNLLAPTIVGARINPHATNVIYIYIWSTHDLSRRAATGRSPAEIVGSNPTGGMDICLLSVVCCQVEVSATS